jgi:lariat debranching enzyme
LCYHRLITLSNTAAGVVNFGGLRIAGLSGIYKEHDYDMGHFERPPYNPGTLRSVYHVRNVETYRLLQLRTPGCEDDSKNIDIMLTHDWPRGIERYGDTQSLLRKKQFFRHEVETNTLGSPVGENLLHTLQPKRWFSAHLHVKFEATVYHQRNEAADHKQYLYSSEMKVEPKSSLDSQLSCGYDDVFNQSTKFSALESFGNCCKVDAASTLTEQMTKFLALDKCLPQRNFLQIITIARPESEQGKDPELKYDVDWLVILYKTAHLTVGAKRKVQIPATPIEITQQDRNEVMRKFNLVEENEPKSTPSGNLRIPLNFRITAPPHQEGLSAVYQRSPTYMIGNPQTDQFLKMLGMQHIITVPYCDSKDQVEKVDNNPKEVDSMREDISMGYEKPEPDNDEITLPDDEESEEISVGSSAKSLDGHRIPTRTDYATSVNSPEVKRPRND